MKILNNLTFLSTLLLLAASPVIAASVPSLDGTQPDGELSLTAEGGLQIDGELRRFFDYFLTARGEVSDEDLRHEVGASAAEKLPARAAAELARLFARYLHFTAIAEAKLDGHDPADVERGYRLLAEAREGAFGARVARQLFGDQLETERAQLLLQKARLDAVTVEQQRAAARLYEASLGADERAARAAARRPLDVRRQVAEMRQAGASDLEVWAVRAEAFGPDAADRLAELDRRRAARR